MNRKRPVVAANWKMFKTPTEGVEYVNDLKIRIWDISRVDVILCVPYTSLFSISALLEHGEAELGAQNMHWESEGAYTGEISPLMLRSSGAKWVILGHSERRRMFGETDDHVVKKVLSAVSGGLRSIVCVGEALAQRKRGETVQVLAQQLEPVLESIREDDLEKLVIAYEPVWAIGTGVNATAETVKHAHDGIRDLLRSFFSSAADPVRILYGGSVNERNAEELIRVREVDGFLVGGASLQVGTFASIIETVDMHEKSRK